MVGGGGERCDDGRLDGEQRAKVGERDMDRYRDADADTDSETDTDRETDAETATATEPGDLQEP